MCRVLDRENARWDEGNREKSWMNGKRKIRREEPSWSGLAAEERLARAKKSGGRGKFRWPKRKAWIPLPPALATLSPSARPSPKHQPPFGLRGSMSATLLLATVAPHNCKSCACYDAEAGPTDDFISRTDAAQTTRSTTGLWSPAIIVPIIIFH